MIKAIIFDLGNVIVNVHWDKLYAKLSASGNKSMAYIENYNESSSALRDFESGKINVKEFYRILSSDLDLNMGLNEFKNAWCNMFSLNKKVEQAIKVLKQRYRLVLLSNVDVVHFNYIKNNYKILDEFDDFVLSYEVGCRKPNPLIFIEAIRKARTMPFNCLYFDDIPLFVLAAKFMGIKAYRFRDYKKLNSDLVKNKISAKPL